MMSVPEGEARRLLGFAGAAVHPPGGFSWLDEHGRPDPRQPVHTWVSARMTYVFALASLQGHPGTADIAEHGVRSLRTVLYDDVYGGWFGSVSLSADPVPVDDTKVAYAHAFVVLAAGAAVAAQVAGADAVLDDALDVVRRSFLDEHDQVIDTFDRRFGEPEPYRGANASMHMVEALLVAGDVRHEPHWHVLALRIAEHLVHGVARSFGYRLPEHFAADWTPLPAYNAERPADPFRPFGSTPGHLLEWSRLLLHLEASLPDPPDWLVVDAAALFDTAVRTGWHVDGEPGFVYTVDWEDVPVVRSRMHWVHAEAIAAAAALYRRTGDPAYDDWFRRWWGFTERHVLDHEHGSWHHELDETNRPATRVWQGKPDVYHAYQAVLLPRLDLAPCAAVQLANHPGPDSPTSSCTPRHL